VTVGLAPVLQSDSSTSGSGTDAAVGGGFVTDLLRQFDVPFAELIGPILGLIGGFVVIYLLGRLVLLPLVDRVLDRRGVEAHAKRPLQKITFAVIVIAAAFGGFAVAGLTQVLQSLATIAAAGTLAIGFALQNVIANFVAGVFIFTDRPFRIGDWIEWDGNAGIVEDISFRVTRVRTFDNELLTVPNSELTDGVIKNPVAKDALRLQVPFGIGYDDDVELATDIILEEASELAELGVVTDGDRAPSVRLTNLGDSSVVLTARIWVRDPSRADVVRIRGEYTTNVKARFDEEGVDIPYPNRTLGGALQVEGFDRLEAAQSDD
jgi:small-conductance mechanosensitive channel